MIYGTFNSKEGKYCFDGHWYTPKWYANGTQNRDWVSIYNICIEGYDSGSPKNWPKAVFVICNIKNLMLWDEVAKSYPGLYAQSQLHYYDASIPAGQVPDWAKAWEQSGTLLMHEYKAGKVVWLREGDFDNDIYIFMKDCDPPAEDTDSDTTETPETEDPDTTTPSTISLQNSKITIKNSILSKDGGDVVVTIEPLEE